MLVVVDAMGRPVRFVLAPGNRQEYSMLLGAIKEIDTAEVIADKALDTNRIRSDLASRRITATIPSKRNRLKPIPLDEDRYNLRHRVENLFADLKQYQSVATRYCKLAESYEAFVHLASWMIETRRLFA